MKEYLTALRQNDTALCVASATAASLMEACLSRLGVRQNFAFLLSCEDVGKGKDSPEIYLQAARRLGCAPCDAAVFEDAIFAAKTAKAAGFYVVGVYDDSAKDRWSEMSALADETVLHW